MIPAAPYSPPLEGITDRFLRWLNLVKNLSQNKKTLYQSALSGRKYYAFYVGMTILTILRLILNFTGFFLIYTAISDYAPHENDYSESADLPYEYATQTFYVLQTNYLSTIAGWCFLASTFLHVAAYIAHKHFLILQLNSNKPKASFSVPDFWIGHISILNWVFDLPGIGVPTSTLTHIVIILINISAGLIFAAALWMEKPITLAWGCYQPGTSIIDLKYGLCPSYINDPQNAHPPVCDQPGVRCGEAEIRWKTILKQTLAQSGFILSISVAIYLTSVSAKSQFYMLSQDLVQDTTDYNNKKRKDE